MDGVAAKLLRSGIASEALRRNMPLRAGEPGPKTKKCRLRLWRRIGWGAGRVGDTVGLERGGSEVGIWTCQGGGASAGHGEG